MRTSDRLRMAFTLAVLIGGGIFVSVWVAIWLLRGSYLSAAIAFGAGLLCLTFAFQMAYAASGAPRLRAEYRPEGTTVRPPKLMDLVFGVGLTAGVAAAALYLAFSPFGMVDYVPTSVLRITLPAGCIFYVLFGAPVLYRMVKHRTGSHLRLRPDGFEVWNGQWGSFKRGKWEEVEQILDHPPRRKKSFQEVIVFELPKGRSAMLVADAITGNSHVLREWVRFYWQHPEHRAELTDGRGLQRLEKENFTAE